MKIVSHTNAEKPEQTSDLMSRLQGIWQFGINWDRDQQAQESLIEHLKKLFDNKYTLVREVSLPGLDIPIPLVLVGPSGLRVIYASALKGFYRAKNETWSEVDNLTHKFKPARPNLVNRALLMSQAISTYLNTEGYNVPDVEPVLFFSQPGVHVDSIRPAVRIVLTDAIERFVGSVIQSRTILNATDIESIAEVLMKPPPVPGEKEPGSSMWRKNETVGSLQMRRWQWLIIAGLVVCAICILGVAVMIVITTV